MSRMKKAFKWLFVLLQTLVSLILFVGSISLLTILWWKFVAHWYLNLPQPVGGDYYNGLTYVVHLRNHLPLPPSGWLSFWNSGVPVIGGYQWFPFYLMGALAKALSPTLAMDIVSVASLWLFIIGAHLLYFQISKSHLFALGLSLLTFVSPALYYQLTAGGFITGSSFQFYLPLALLFLFRYFESKQHIRSLVLAGALTGIALLHHTGLALLFVFLPQLVMITIHNWIMHHNLHRFLGKMIVFTGFALLLGGMGLYPFFSSMFFGEIASLCDNPQCWGIYPLHLRLWFGYLPIQIAIIWGLITFLYLLAQKFRRAPLHAHLVFLSVVGLLSVLWFPLAAYLHLINQLVNSFNPRRMFWTIFVLLMVFVASCFQTLTGKRVLIKVPISVIFVIAVAVFIKLEIKLPFDLQLPLTHPQTAPDTDPTGVEEWLIPKYKKSELVDHFPAWLFPGDPHYRIDSQNVRVTQWLQVASDIPSTRGFTSSFNHHQIDWAYYLQTALGDNQPAETPASLITKRAQFLFDAFGIGYILTDRYHDAILTNQNLIKESKGRFIQLNPDYTSPIVAPVVGTPVLFIGDEIGYTTFIRTLGNSNLNSRILIPVKGPQHLSGLTKELMAQFPVLFLYRFEGSLEKVDEYVRNGGKVFADFGSLKKIPTTLAPLLPSAQLQEAEETEWSLKVNQDASITKGIDSGQFGPLKYQNNPWKMVTFESIVPSDSVTPLIQQRGKPIMVQLQKEGTIVISGMNLPFHIIEYNSPQESKLFEKMLLSLTPEVKKAPPSAEVTRPSPEHILVDGKNLSGIYFKENFHPGWYAYVNGKSATVYPAGMDFMYIPVPYTTTSSKVEIVFKGSFTTWSLWYLTLLGLLIVVLIVIAPKKVEALLRKIVSHPLYRLNLLTHHASDLAKDEDKEY